MKNFKGGYKIISLEGKDLTTSFSVTGIYNALTETYQKTILVTGIVISGEKKNDAYTEVNIDSDDYKFTIYGYEVTVADDDSVEASVTDIGVTSIGGETGDFTLGTGLTLTDHELSASAGETKLYKHYYRNVTGSITVYLVSPYSTLATTKNDFAKRVVSASMIEYFDANGVLRIGTGCFITTWPDISGTITLIGASNEASPSWNRTEISGFSTNTSNTIEEL